MKGHGIRTIPLGSGAHSMTNPFEGIQAVLFDLDGTLVETNIDFPLMKREKPDLIIRDLAELLSYIHRLNK